MFSGWVIGRTGRFVHARGPFRVSCMPFARVGQIIRYRSSLLFARVGQIIRYRSSLLFARVGQIVRYRSSSSGPLGPGWGDHMHSYEPQSEAHQPPVWLGGLPLGTDRISWIAFSWPCLLHRIGYFDVRQEHDDEEADDQDREAAQED